MPCSKPPSRPRGTGNEHRAKNRVLRRHDDGGGWAYSEHMLSRRTGVREEEIPPIGGISWSASTGRISTGNGRFPDSDETTPAARQNRNMECPEIASGNHGVVTGTDDGLPDTDRC